jgi:hypothetical protein
VIARRRRLVCGLLLVGGLALNAADADAQRYTCPPPQWTLTQLEALKQDGFKVPDTFLRHELAVALPACLGHPNPNLRDGIAFEALSSWMRAGQLDLTTMKALRGDLLKLIAKTDAGGLTAPFAALVLSEVARTDRLTAWMTAEEREEMVRVAAAYLANVSDYRAFDDKEGFRHGVAHGADFVLQLVLNPQTTKAQLDRLMIAVASQVSPGADVAYWAGEPDRLARPVAFMAQRKLHSESDWRAFFLEITDPKPLPSWQAAFTSTAGIKKRHNVRAFLLSVYASASSSDDPGVRHLIAPVTAALKTVP